MGDSLTILLVDDQPNIREVVSDELTASGYRVLTAGDGSEALEFLGQGGVDLILLDWHMPAMDGHTFLDHKFGDARFSSIPVIICSGLAEAEDISHSVEDVLQKPFSIAQLRKAIQAALASG